MTRGGIRIGLLAAAMTGGLAGPGCSRRSTPTSAAAGTPINRPGTYVFKVSGDSLRVWIDESQLVQYDLIDARGASVVHSTERASNNSRWELTLDDSRRLWFYSGDVGMFVWDGDTSGMTRPVAGDATLLQSAPQSMRGHVR